MFEAIFMVIGFLIGFFLMFGLVTKALTIAEVEYRIVLENEGGTKVLKTFTRYYWSQKKADKEIKRLKLNCEMIRSDLVEVDDELLKMIDEQFEIDYKQVYLKHSKGTIKPL